MMREILFKAKRTDKKEWVEGYPFPSVAGKELNRMTVFEPFPGGTVVNTYEIDPETLCQYTGRKDAKGIKIFSCDKLFFDLENRIYTVTWDFLKSSFNLVCGDIENSMIGAPYCVIVGNIYDKDETT